MCSPMAFAAASGRSGVVQLLRDHGAVPDALPLQPAASLALSPRATGAGAGGGPIPSTRPLVVSEAAPRMTVGDPGDDDELPPDYDSIQVRKSGPGVS
ncbi:hypothetical protein MAPG_09391 [Magnaporthiopsis poae ATCC 64411]|uniref:Uncharacterized protein n=1 Tax=Magnaporthiopsis poae (strain ATCC 64411 / 73-15) TaxID=644358 RepID=A0A0C4E9U1_MAGP6|nr:hypothetical protein MAPG_09391 [Magnaporthiopsis poae ATCC 64411]